MNITYLFPGQGSQVVGMGEDFFNASKLAQEMFEAASETLKTDMKKLLFEENAMLNQTEFSQPAILLVSSLAHKLFSSQNPPTFALGHSLGEFSSLVSVGALDYIDAIALVHERGLLMKKACEGKDAAMMAVIGIGYGDLQEICKDFQQENKQIWMANINNESQIVLAGTRKDLSSVEQALKEKGAKRVILLPMSVASHCPLLEPITKPFGEILSLHVKSSFNAPIISNVTAATYKTKDEACALLQKQLISPVQYVKSIEFAEKKTDVFIEFGGSVLKGLNRRITKKPTYSITDMSSLENTINELS